MLGDREWCVSGAISLADVTVACHVGFIALRRAEFFPPDRYPGLARLCRRMEARESLKKTAPPV
jgi:glutathione S-transferase